MDNYKLFGSANKQEEELMCILLSSSLYQDMAPEDKQKLLNYLITSYFNIVSIENSRALPAAIHADQ